MSGAGKRVQNSMGYVPLEEGQDNRSVEPFSLWARRMLSTPLYLFLVIALVIGGLFLCVEHPWSQEHKTKHSIRYQVPYEGSEIFEYEEYTFGVNATVILGNGTLDLTIWEIVIPYINQPFAECPAEPYTITSEGSKFILTLTNITSNSDCIYKKLHEPIPSKLKMSLNNELEYDQYHERITVHFSILDLVKFDIKTYPSTNSPTHSPTSSPTFKPTPTASPTTLQPTKHPTKSPTDVPSTLQPTFSPTLKPTRSPVSDPTTAPPTRSPTKSPVPDPTTALPTFSPTIQPTRTPTEKPSHTPTKTPSVTPTAKTEPKGLYKGSETVVGTTIDGQLSVTNPGFCDLQVLVSAANLNITCLNEKYTMDGDTLDLTDINTEGDCLHDNLSDDGVTLKSVTFDGTTDEVQVTVKYKFLTKSLTLTHQNSVDNIDDKTF